MPIANCFVRAGVPAAAEIHGLTCLWAQESCISDDHMTINMAAGTRQDGAPYSIVAFLYLPSSWSSEDVGRLQVGLARALAKAFALDPADVQVITSIVESGHVVENGETQEW